MPYGILHAEQGAEVGFETTTITADDIIHLYFSLESKYRNHAVWIMNDKMAMTLRLLKDSNGQYVWQDNTLLGKEVLISNFKPDTISGNKPIVFGDFSYYLLVYRTPLQIQVLTEKFAAVDQTGYLGSEFLDGRLVRRKAAKALVIAE